MNKLIPWFTENYPSLVEDMNRCQHGLDPFVNLNPYHLEGSVWTHTIMVCNVIPKNANITIKLAALLHDIGKVVTRNPNWDKMKTTFYSHQNFSAFKALEILKHYWNEHPEFSEKDIAHTFKLIVHHQDMHLLSVEQLKERFIDQTFFMKDLEVLHKADSLGRICADNKEYKSNVYPPDKETFKEVGQVFMMVGLPCSGKSSWAKAFSDLLETPDVEYLCSDCNISSLHPELTYNEAFKVVDQKEVDGLFNEKLAIAKKNVKIVIIDKTNMSKKARKRMLNNFSKNWKKTAFVMLCDLKEIDGRNYKREGKYIPEEVINKMIHSYSNPTFDDFDEIEYIL